MIEDPKALWWIQTLAYAAFAAFGGFMGHLLRTIEKGEKINWVRVIVETCSAGFVGVITLLICQSVGIESGWTGVIVGVSGWLGATTSIQLIEKVLRNRLGVDKKDGE